MKYMILIHSNPHFYERWEKLSGTEREEFGRRHYALSDELADSGELVISEALSDPSLGRRVTVRDGQTMTTDGPFAEVKEHGAVAGAVRTDGATVAAKLLLDAMGLGALSPLAR